MSENMFCFQCEQTAGCKGCTGKAGVCGKTADVAKAQDDLTGALIGLSRAVTVGKVKATGKTTKLVIKGLFATITNVNFDNSVPTIDANTFPTTIKNVFFPACAYDLRSKQSPQEYHIWMLEQNSL